MTGPDPYEDPEGIALVEGILERVGWTTRPKPPIVPVVDIDFTEVRDALAAVGIALDSWQLAVLENTTPLRRMVDAFKQAGLVPDPLPDDPRQRALAAKQRAGKGPPSPVSWRGRERATKFRSQS